MHRLGFHPFQRCLLNSPHLRLPNILLQTRAIDRVVRRLFLSSARLSVRGEFTPRISYRMTAYRFNISLRRNASDNTSKQGHSSQPIPIPPTKPKRNGHSSGAGSLTHSSSSGSSSSNQRSASPHTPPTQVVTGTTIPAEWVHPLPLTLEQLFKGGKHEYKITRHMLDGSKKDQVVLVDVQPGWKSGTRITFPRAGNEYAPGRFQDVIFVVEQIHHERLARLDGGRLVVTEMIDLPDAMNAGRKPQTRRIVGVDGKVIEFVAPSCVIKNGMETVVKGHGMYLRSKSHVVGRGDLVIRWVVPQRYISVQVF